MIFFLAKLSLANKKTVKRFTILNFKHIFVIFFMNFSKRDDFFNDKLQWVSATTCNFHDGFIFVGGKCVVPA